MAVEDQELRLKVVLDDQASAGLARLKGSVTELTSGQAAASMEKFKRGQAEIGEGIKKLTELATGGERAMLGFIGRFGALGVAAAGLGTVLTSTALKLADLADKAKLSGLDPARMKGFVDQLEKAGVASDVASESATRFAGALADLSRFGSQRYQALLNMAGTHKAEMIAGIREVERAATIEEKFNKARELADNVARYRHDEDIRRGKDETVAAADAAKARIEFYQKLTDMDPSTLLLRNMENLTDAEKKRNEALLDNARKIKTSLDELKKSTELVGESLIKAFGPDLARTLKQDAEDLEWIVKSVEKLKGFFTDKPATGPNAPPGTFGDLIPKLFGGGAAPGPGFTEEQRQQGAEKFRSGQGTRLAPNGSSVGPGTGEGAHESPPPQGGAAPHAAAATGDRASRIVEGKAAIADQLRKEGVPEANIPEAANLLAGQALAESGFNPTESHDRGTGYGIYGARNERRSAMLSWMKEQGYAPSSLEGQSRYMAHEAMSGKYPKTRESLTGAEPGSRQARTTAITREFEAPRIINPRTGFVGEAAATMAKVPSAAPDAASQPIPPGGGGKYEAGASLAGVNPRLAAAIQGAGAYLPEGYTVKPSSGFRGGTMQSYHGKGSAIDVQIYDPSGRKITNRGDDPEAVAIYQRYAQGVKTWATANDPELVSRLGWGGAFGTQLGGGGVPDLMHFDLGGSRGRMRPERQMGRLPLLSSIDNDRAAVDAAKSQNVNVNATGKLTANINAPPGTNVTASGDGLFKKTEVNRQTQMAPAAVGPEIGGGGDF
jgi:hypothetical protein